MERESAASLTLNNGSLGNSWKELMQRKASSGDAEAQALARETERLFADSAASKVQQ